MRQQYGLRVQGEEFGDMGWDEFCDLLSGLNEQTPLVRVAQIRLEKDPEAIRNFTPEQRATRNAWLKKRALGKSEEETAKFLSSIEKAFSRML